MGELAQGCIAGTSLQPGQADRDGPTMRSGYWLALADATKPQSHSSDDSWKVVNLRMNHSFVAGLGSSGNLTM